VPEKTKKLTKWTDDFTDARNWDHKQERSVFKEIGKEDRAFCDSVCLAQIGERSAQTRFCVWDLCETLAFAFRSTERDDLIVDVHEKTTTIGSGFCVTPRLNPWAAQLAATVSAAPVAVKFR
jgi:hypothetical protein